MKIVTVVGARPQFIKSAPVSKALRAFGHVEVLVHTGQHYDDGMSAVFFRELEITAPNVNLGVGSGSHGWQTGQMLIHIENVLFSEKPDWVLVYGDTNSTLAGALAAVKLHVPVAHVEAGLRSFNREMPEEHNRVISDHLSNLLFCPTQTAVKNLKNEGITLGVNLVGDVMYDSILFNIQLAEKQSHILENLKLKNKKYALATVHRPENTDNYKRLNQIFQALEMISKDGFPVVIPLHPRTRKVMEYVNLSISGLKLIPPVSYLDMLRLEKQAQIILTDSGGVQKEAYWLGVPCITLRDDTEWVELVEHGFNIVSGADTERIYESYKMMVVKRIDLDLNLYGSGNAGEKIVNILTS